MLWTTIFPCISSWTWDSFIAFFTYCAIIVEDNRLNWLSLFIFEQKIFHRVENSVNFSYIHEQAGFYPACQFSYSTLLSDSTISIFLNLKYISQLTKIENPKVITTA